MKHGQKVYTGVLHNANKSSSDWGWQGLVSHGVQTFVVVTEPKSVQTLQVLQGHKANVTKTKWAHENYHHDTANPYQLRLASADTSGVIIVWDVAQGVITSQFNDGSKTVSDIQWLGSHCRDLLVLYHPYVLSLWNADTGMKIWKKTYIDNLISFCLDPFDPTHLAFLGQDCIIFIEDFSLTKLPSSSGKKFYISSPSTPTGIPNSHSSGSLSEKKGSLNLAKRMGRILIGDAKANETERQSVSTECLQLCFHPAVRHHLILLYTRDILLVDLDINQTVGIIPMERSGSPFVQVWPCRQRDAILCLHDNGSVSLRVRRRADVICTPSSDRFLASDDFLVSPSQAVTYDLRCQTDPIRLTKHSKVSGMSVCPLSDRTIALTMSDSRVILWSLHAVPDTESAPSLDHPLPSYRDKDLSHPKMTLGDMIGPTQDDCLTNHVHLNSSLKFTLHGLLNGINGQITAIKMCPALTTKNWNHYKPLLGVGLQTGGIQVYNLTRLQVDKEFSVHTSPVRGIEWLGLSSFLSYAYPSPIQNGTVKNELVLLDTITGHIEHLRTNKDNEVPIDFIRVSSLKHYFIIVLRDQPCELWDAERLVLLREISRNLTCVTSIEWAPSAYCFKPHKKKLNKQDSIQSPSIMEPSGDKSTRPIIREHLILTDQDGTVHHMVVEGSVVLESSKISSEPGMSSITSIVWKGDYVMYGDSEGHFNSWDLRTKRSKYLQTNRGYVRKLRFAPGRGNFKFLALFNSGLDVWDGETMQYLERLRQPRDVPRIIDAEWAASEQLVLATEDGCIRLTDIKFSRQMSPINHHSFLEPCFCPHTCSTLVSLTIKYMLQHQTFTDTYRLKLKDVDNDLSTAVNDQLSVLPKNIRQYLEEFPLSTAERCLIAARLMGDENEVDFWSIGLHYLLTDASSQPNIAMTSPTDVTNQPMRYSPYSTLDFCYDVLTAKDAFLKYQLDRLCLHDNKRTSYEHTVKCSERSILLGQTDRAVQLLLETEPDNEHYYEDSLRACLVASVTSSGASQSTIKLVATNLIANGKLYEGVQLLCLIDKTLDGCRYLQTYGHWDKAAWLAKASLTTSDCNEIMKRWIDHLCSATTNQKNQAVMVMISLRQYTSVIEMLYTMRYFDRAICFLEACLDFGVLERNRDNAALFDAVFLEYARYLASLGNKRAAQYYCNLAGDKGDLFLKEIEIMFSDNSEVEQETT